MKYFFCVDQLTLSHWKELKPIDVLIVAFIRDLNPKNPEIKKHMKNGYFMIVRSWLLQEMPLLRCSEKTLTRRLHFLEEKGILDRKPFITPIGKVSFYRLSKLYFKIEAQMKARSDLKRANTGKDKISLPIGTKMSAGRDKMSPITSISNTKIDDPENSQSHVPGPPKGPETASSTDEEYVTTEEGLRHIAEFKKSLEEKAG